ncbi:hypothetical protein NP233_g57 [Leucocoprinus birnbaumii]|uniref:Uncharacterized protein n=1 Tax=Leucocoprinus birnbaumii TaxID=56174 RepID=A0AAD5W4B4_9AGAR|nr:hypothetical protein NP233_g57 [Leucocoprinus birnbaumii]
MSAKPTGQDIVNRLETIKIKIKTLSSSIAQLKGVENLQQALDSHTIALEIKGLLDTTSTESHVREIVAHIRLADEMVYLCGYTECSKASPTRKMAKRALELSRDYRDLLQDLLGDVVAKLPICASLPVANLAGLLTQDLKDLHQSAVKMANAMIDNAPVRLHHNLLQSPSLTAITILQDDENLKKAARASRDEIDNLFKKAVASL